MKLYLDANVFRFSAIPIAKDAAELQREIDLLPAIAGHVSTGRLTAVTHAETWFETWSMPPSTHQAARFYGASVGSCSTPIDYARPVMGVGIDFRRAQIWCLSQFRDLRFVEIQRAVGAYQGRGKLHENQLLDAFAIWCAEHDACDGFLTLDFSLCRHAAKDSGRRIKIRIFRPSELLDEIAKTA